MGKLLSIDLSTKVIKDISNILDGEFHYGRGLALRLMDKFTYSIVLVPGLFSGTLAPSTGRLLMGYKDEDEIKFSNLAGTISQKLASLNIDGIVITGQYSGENFAHINISNKGITINEIVSEKDNTATKTIEQIRNNFGEDSGIIGIGKAGESMHPISTIFSTYPNKTPYYYCARRGLGSEFGEKKLKAISVTNSKHFEAEVYDRESMSEESKHLSRIIIDNPICGGALPAFGSITLIKLMRQGAIESIIKELDKKRNESNKQSSGIVLDINRTCSPLCVVGCLNRHANKEGEFFLSPAESEVHAALIHSFNIDDMMLASKLNYEAFELGIDSVELVFSIALIFKAMDMEPTMENILNSVEEIRNNTLFGRVLGCKTSGIYKVFKNRIDLCNMVTKPSVTEEKQFSVEIPNMIESCIDMDHMDYLYAYMIAIENLGFCLFTIFGFLDNKNSLEILKNLFKYKTGKVVEEKDLIDYGMECIDLELAIGSKKNQDKNIPEFVKVLYRYYSCK